MSFFVFIKSKAKASPNRYKKIKVAPHILSDHYGLKLSFNNRNNRKPIYSWKLNNTSQRSLGQGRNKEIKDFLEFNENEDIAHPNLWDTMKGKFIALRAFTKKLERSYTGNLTVHLEALEQKEANTPKRNRRQEVAKLGSKINQLETKNAGNSMP